MKFQVCVEAMSEYTVLSIPFQKVSGISPPPCMIFAVNGDYSLDSITVQSM
jgi:hypothetical protein